MGGWCAEVAKQRQDLRLLHKQAGVAQRGVWFVAVIETPDLDRSPRNPSAGIDIAQRSIDSHAELTAQMA